MPDITSLGIKVDSTDVTRGTKALNELGKAGATAEKGTKKIETATDKMNNSLTRAKVTTLALTAAIGVGFVLAVTKLNTVRKEAVSLANEQEKAEAKLNAVLKATGNAAGFSLSQLKEMAGGMQAVTTVGDEVTLSGMAILATFKQVREEGFERGTLAALNMSAVMGTDLNSSILQVGKALNDPILGMTALSRAGVQFTTEQKEIVKVLQESGKMMRAQEIILAELESQFDGAAESLRKTYGGSVIAAENALGDLKEEIGFLITKNSFFIKAVKLSEDTFIDWTKSIQNNKDMLMELSKTITVSLVGSIEVAIETMRFFQNGWYGVELAGNIAITAIATGVSFLYETLRDFLLGLDLVMEGLVKVGAIESNPFDYMSEGLSDFSASSMAVTKQVVADIEKTNNSYDIVISKISKMKNELQAIIAKKAESDSTVFPKLSPNSGNEDPGNVSSGVSSSLEDPWGVGEEARLQSVEDSLMKEYDLRVESAQRTSELAASIVDPWEDAEELRLQKIEDSLMKEAQLRLEAKSRNEVFTEEFVKVSNAATADIVSAVVAGEETKVAVAGIASSALTQYAIDAATTGLTPIFEALGGQIGAWVGLGAAEESTEGVGWVQKLANAGKYLVGAGAAVLAGKAVGDTFNAQGGWLGQNPGGGRVSGGPPGIDTVFGGYTDGGTTRNWLNNNEYVIDAATAEKNYDILEAMRGSKKRLFEEGGPVSDAWEPTRGINDSGFDTFWDSVIESQGDWRAAIVESIGYYAGTGAGMISGKLVGKNLFANGGPVRDRGYGFGGFISDILDPGQVFHDSDSGVAEGMMDVWAGGDPGTNAIFGQILPWIGGQAGTSYLDQATGIDPASIDWGQLWKQARDLPIVGETVERADKILYPFVRDTLTPGEYPSFGTIEDMLKGMYEGLGSELATHVSTGGASMLLGSFETGTDYVPETGPYLLHGGEDVTSVPQKKEQTEAINSLIAEVKQLRNSLESLGASTVVATKKTAKTLDRMYADSLEVTA